MTHPYDALLNEFAFAIKHFVPTIPDALRQQAQATLERFKSDPSMTEEQIKQAFFDIGVQEYPHRHAYKELTEGTAKEELKAMVLEHLDENVRSVVKPYLDSGVALEELVKSDLFESQLTPEQRYQVEDGILLANKKMAEKLKQQVSAQEQTYEALVDKWTAHAQEIVKAIDALEALAPQGDENQRAEIRNKAERYREGFLVTEPDPELEEVKKEIEYWQETFEPTE